MKNPLYFAFLFFIGSLLVPLNLDLLASGVNQKKSKIFPVDSEHSAIFQCLDKNNF